MQYFAETVQGERRGRRRGREANERGRKEREERDKQTRERDGMVCAICGCCYYLTFWTACKTENPSSLQVRRSSSKLVAVIGVGVVAVGLQNVSSYLLLQFRCCYCCC